MYYSEEDEPDYTLDYPEPPKFLAPLLLIAGIVLLFSVIYLWIHHIDNQPRGAVVILSGEETSTVTFGEPQPYYLMDSESLFLSI